MREIILDTETTGLDPASGHRVVEIGCLELVNHVPTGKSFHVYLNPDRDVPEEVVKVHGLTAEFLADKPRFTEICEEFLDFVQDSPIIAHNSDFDMRFINAELALCGRMKIAIERAIDTVALARKKFPGAPASLDALCKRFMIDNTSRTLHGALLDAQLLAEVYLELMGGRQPDLVLAAASEVIALAQDVVHRAARPHAASEAELAAHTEFLKKLTKPIWLN